MIARLRHRRRVDRMIRDWTEYRSMVLDRLGTDDLRPEEEGRFLSLKGRLAERAAGLGQEMTGQHAHEITIGQREIVEFLNRHTTLHCDEPLLAPAREAFERDWHRHFLYLNRVRGLRPQRKPRPREHRPAAASPPASTYRPRPEGFGRWLAVLLLRLGVLAVVVYAAVRLVPWGAVKAQAERTDSARAGGWVASGWQGAKGVARDLGSSSLRDFFAPVVDRYGPELTAIMSGVLLLAVGYWLFIRTK
jgi:hypothetical protein